MESSINFCLYYQAHITKSEIWFFVAALKSWEHTAFDRTIDAQNDIFEFFVPIDMQERFMTFMHMMEKKGVASNLVQLPNRLANPVAVV